MNKQRLSNIVHVFAVLIVVGFFTFPFLFHEYISAEETPTNIPIQEGQPVKTQPADSQQELKQAVKQKDKEKKVAFNLNLMERLSCLMLMKHPMDLEKICLGLMQSLLIRIKASFTLQ